MGIYAAKYPQALFPGGRESIPEWFAHGACVGHSDIMFPEYVRGGDMVGKYAPAKAVCASCPVLALCRQYVVTKPSPEKHGVWAGMTAREIASERRLWRERRAAA